MNVTRFAPSPTGYLHLGHAFAALVAHQAAQNGRFLLRIEDLDAGRSRPGFIDAIFEDLRWLELVWDEPVLRQSERTSCYRAALERLESQGVIYPCFCSRAEIAVEIARAVEAPQGPDGPLYPGTCRMLSPQQRAETIKSGSPYALRLDSRTVAESLPSLAFEELADTSCRAAQEIAVEPLLFGDVVVARKGFPASYHLAVVVDDAAQGVTLVTRGSDLLPATHIQRVLQSLLGLPAPRYAHHRLIVDDQGRKLSKRELAPTLRSLRARGVTASQIREHLLRQHPLPIPEA